MLPSEREKRKYDKLSKVGEKLKVTNDRSDIDKSISSRKLNDWVGLSQNTNLTSEDFKNIFIILKESATADKTESITGAQATRNFSLRSAIRRNLLKNASLPREYFEQAIVLTKRAGSEILQNPNITPEDLDLYFNNVVMNWDKNTYSFIYFAKLLGNAKVPDDLVDSWAETLLEFSDWSYTDSQWYSIVNAFLGNEYCPYEIMEGAAKAKISTEVHGWPEMLRKKAVEHPNSDDRIKRFAYEVNPLEIYLPDSVKDIFLF